MNKATMLVAQIQRYLTFHQDFGLSMDGKKFESGRKHVQNAEDETPNQQLKSWRLFHIFE
jgi:hypothetical protein